MQLSEYLSQNNETARAFGSKIGVKGPATIYRYMQGIRFPSARILKKIEEATNGEVTANDFLSASCVGTPAQEATR